MAQLEICINIEKDKEKLKVLLGTIEALGLEYTITEDEELNDEQKNEILRREKEYKSGRMKMYSVQELKALLK